MFNGYIDIVFLGRDKNTKSSIVDIIASMK